MKLRYLLAFAAVILVTSVPMLAHHSIAAEFDQSKDITVKGTVTKVEWMNPHIWVYIDAKDASGNVVKWQCEGGAPNSLTRNGWTRNALKIGDEVTIAGYPAKNGTNTCNSRQVTLPDGRRVFAGSAAGDGKE
jgi:V8-like Glu-specific endopeptidase